MQIGPRIRVRGTLGKFGDKAKKVVQKAASNPWVQGGLGLLTGGATIPLLAGAAGGFLKEHAGVGDVLKGGAKGFAAGGAGKLARSGLSALASGGANAASAANGARLASLPTELPAVSTIGGAAAPASNVAAAAAPESLSLAGRVADVGGKALSFAKNNPTATALGLQAAGDLATAGAENRRLNLEADLLEQRIGESQYDLAERKRREAALVPYWGALGTAFGQSKVAANPYLPAVG